MSRRKQRKRTVAPSGYDKHHLLFYRKLWDKGYKQLLRRAFVYELPITVHQQLHAVVGAIPPLDEREAQELWSNYNYTAKRGMSLYEALDWLIANSPNDEFRHAMIEQYAFIRFSL